MKLAIKNYIPINAVKDVEALFQNKTISIVIKKERKTRFGDYRKLKNGNHQITINQSLNQYRFLITLIHEYAHYKAYKMYGDNIKPHGKEWKTTFKYLMLPFINPNIFPEELLPFLANHFKNPKASTATDEKLILALSRYDVNTNKTYIFEIPYGSNFKIHNGREFKKIKKRVKRYECLEVSSGKLYLFSPNAEIIALKEV